MGAGEGNDCSDCASSVLSEISGWSTWVRLICSVCSVGTRDTRRFFRRHIINTARAANAITIKADTTATAAITPVDSFVDAVVALSFPVPVEFDELLPK